MCVPHVFLWGLTRNGHDATPSSTGVACSSGCAYCELSALHITFFPCSNLLCGGTYGDYGCQPEGCGKADQTAGGFQVSMCMRKVRKWITYIVFVQAHPPSKGGSGFTCATFLCMNLTFSIPWFCQSNGITHTNSCDSAYNKLQH